MRRIFGASAETQAAMLRITQMEREERSFTNTTGHVMIVTKYIKSDNHERKARYIADPV
jgi:hypothetical protein